MRPEPIEIYLGSRISGSERPAGNAPSEVGASCSNGSPTGVGDTRETPPTVTLADLATLLGVEYEDEASADAIVEKHHARLSAAAVESAYLTNHGAAHENADEDDWALGTVRGCAWREPSSTETILSSTLTHYSTEG